MKTMFKILAILALLSAHAGYALDDISGTWQGKLPLQGDATLTVQFILHREADGSWSALVNSPDTGGIKNVRANTVSYDNGRLRIEVADLTGAYQGEFRDGVFHGQWSQAGNSMPLDLKPYVKPVLSSADMELLRGEWNGKLKLPVGELTIVFRFEGQAAGEFKGFLDSPDQGAKDIPISDIELSDADVTFKIPRIKGEYQAKVAGEEMTGTFRQGTPLPLNMHKGKYQPPESKLSLSREAMEELRGEWHGELDTPVGPLTVVYLFETDAAGDNHAFRLNPDQGNNRIPVTEASLVDGNLTLKTAGPGGAFTGKLAGAEIRGNISGPLGAVPLTLKKGSYTPPVYALALSKHDMALLQGKWQGKLKTPQRELTLVFRFEQSDDGKYYGFVDSPDQGANGLKIMEANLKDGELSLKVRFPRAAFTGKLSGNELSGKWLQGMGSMPLVMKKE